MVTTMTEHPHDEWKRLVAEAVIVATPTKVSKALMRNYAIVTRWYWENVVTVNGVTIDSDGVEHLGDLYKTKREAAADTDATVAAFRASLTEPGNFDYEDAPEFDHVKAIYAGPTS